MKHDLHDYLRLLLDFVKNGKTIAAVWILLFGTGTYTVLGMFPSNDAGKVEEMISVEPSLPATQKDTVSFCLGLMKRHIKKHH